MTLSNIEIPQSEAIYLHSELEELNLSYGPKHVAIIMDGNRRWAKEKGLPSAMGHWEGAEILIEIVLAGIELGIKTLTVYAFSRENWNRPNGEVDDLMDLFQLYLIRQKERMAREGIRLDAIGDLEGLPQKVLDALNESKKSTEHCARINLVLALNYGGRDEIKRAVVKMVEEKIAPDQITEKSIAKYLDTSRFGDPDLLIRTSGEMRMSNFLLWQISYTEIYSTEVLWPDFSAKELLKAVLSFQKRHRRLGG